MMDMAKDYIHHNFTPPLSMNEQSRKKSWIFGTSLLLCASLSSIAITLSNTQLPYGVCNNKPQVENMDTFQIYTVRVMRNITKEPTIAVIVIVWNLNENYNCNWCHRQRARNVFGRPKANRNNLDTCVCERVYVCVCISFMENVIWRAITHFDRYARLCLDSQRFCFRFGVSASQFGTLKQCYTNEPFVYYGNRKLPIHRSEFRL